MALTYCHFCLSENKNIPLKQITVQKQRFCDVCRGLCDAPQTVFQCVNGHDICTQCFEEQTKLKTNTPFKILDLDTKKLRYDSFYAFLGQRNMDYNNVLSYVYKAIDKTKAQQIHTNFRIGTDAVIQCDNISHAFISTVIYAFSNEKSLALYPHDFLHLIRTALAENINQQTIGANKKNLVVIRDDFVIHSAMNDWHGVFDEFGVLIKKNLSEDYKEICDLFMEQNESNFPSSDSIVNAIGKLTLMNGFKNLFDYTVVTKCGIPRIYLKGTTEEWKLFKILAENLVDKFQGNDTWKVVIKRYIKRIADQACDTCSCDVNFWNDFIKFKSMSGTNEITGWINVFFPYQYLNDCPQMVDFTTFLLPDDVSVYKSYHIVKSFKYYGKSACNFPFIWEYVYNKIPCMFYGGQTFCKVDGELSKANDYNNIFITVSVGYAYAVYIE